MYLRSDGVATSSKGEWRMTETIGIADCTVVVDLEWELKGRLSH